MSALEFNTLVISNTGYLKPFAFSLTRDNETAKDLLQDTIYKALVNHDKYNVGTNIKAWLYTIMRNIFINDYRRQVKQNTIIDKSENGFLLDSKQAAVANEAISGINIKEVKSAIHNLPKIFKIPFMLYFEGYKYHEIAGMLKEPMGTIKSRIHFARKLLKEELTAN